MIDAAAATASPEAIRVRTVPSCRGTTAGELPRTVPDGGEDTPERGWRQRSSPEVVPASPEKWFSVGSAKAKALAERAEMGSAVHEGLADDRPAASWARLALLSVCVQRMGEITGLPVHVEVLRVEAGAALRERLRQHRPDFGQQGLGAGATQRVRRLVVVDASRP